MSMSYKDAACQIRAKTVPKPPMTLQRAHRFRKKTGKVADNLYEAALPDEVWRGHPVYIGEGGDGQRLWIHPDGSVMGSDEELA